MERWNKEWIIGVIWTSSCQNLEDRAGMENQSSLGKKEIWVQVSPRVYLSLLFLIWALLHCHENDDPCKLLLKI